jgi:hypothetical protein
MKSLYDLLFGDPKAAYARARANTAAADAGMSGALASLDGADSFLFGTLLNGAAVRLAPDALGHGLTCGASGSGKSSALSLMVEGFAAAPRHRAELIDPKGETCIVLAERAAMTYLALPAPQQDAFAARFHVIDVRDDAVTPPNLFAVPPQMSPALLASLRASAMVNAGDHDFSDLMQHGLFLVFSVAIALQRGITKTLVRRLFLDEIFRRQTLAPKIHDPALRDSIEHLEDVLPTATRQALVRQFDMHLSTRLGRIWFERVFELEVPEDLLSFLRIVAGEDDVADDAEDWANESHKLGEDAYSQVLKKLGGDGKISNPELKADGKIIEDQLLRAGVRLAKAINEALQ